MSGNPFSTGSCARMSCLNQCFPKNGTTGATGPRGSTGATGSGATGATGATGPAFPAGTLALRATSSAGQTILPGTGPATVTFTATYQRQDGLPVVGLYSGNAFNFDPLTMSPGVYHFDTTLLVTVVGDEPLILPIFIQIVNIAGAVVDAIDYLYTPPVGDDVGSITASTVQISGDILLTAATSIGVQVTNLDAAVTINLAATPGVVAERTFDAHLVSGA